jgi:hypothetical protein
VIVAQFNGTDHSLPSLPAFRAEMSRYAEHLSFELWLSKGDGPSICMLRNKEHAFLMYLRFPGDAGFTSVGSSGSAEPVAYTLSNGQVDEYPISWCVPVAQCFEALAFFFSSAGQRTESIAWHAA